MSVKEPIQNEFFLSQTDKRYRDLIHPKWHRQSAIVLDNPHDSSLVSSPRDFTPRDWSDLTSLTKLVDVAVSFIIRNTIFPHPKTLELTRICGINLEVCQNHKHVMKCHSSGTSHTRKTNIRNDHTSVNFSRGQNGIHSSQITGNSNV